MATDTSGLIAKASEVIDILKREGDRGCVLVAAALLEEAIEAQIKARLLPPPGKSDELVSNSPTAPISSFSGKIDLAYRLGLLTDGERITYHQLRNLRNACAHSTAGQDFSQSSFKDRITQMISKSERLWETMRLVFGPVLAPGSPPVTIHEFVEKAGWRHSFTLFFSLVVAHKILYVERVTQLRTVYARPKG